MLVATRNLGKLAELRALFASIARPVVDLTAAGVLFDDAEDDLEKADTFEANALAKARYYHRASGGLATVADDSGLEVVALDGAPGVLSRRWSGFEGDERAVTCANNAKLLERLTGNADRTARFTCVVAYVDSTREITARGVTTGRISTSPRGTNGFGYDPLFEADALDGRTFGEATAAEKESVSHRASAFAALVTALGGNGVPSRAREV